MLYHAKSVSIAEFRHLNCRFTPPTDQKIRGSNPCGLTTNMQLGSFTSIDSIRSFLEGMKVKNQSYIYF